MATFELILTLLTAVVALVWVADRTRVPYPMMLLAGGIILAVLPWTPVIELDPELVLVIFLPPILFQAAQTTSLRDFKIQFNVISRLAIGLVLATTAAVAVVAHFVIPELGWPAAFVLGAVVSPPDAVAATAIFNRLGAPGRIVTILEGESLINDASAIVLYTFAVSAVVTGSFSFGAALLEFVIVVVVGVGIGVVAGRGLGKVVTLIGDPTLSAIVLLLAPAGIYVLTENLGGSGVLAVVVAGLIHGYFASHSLSAAARVRGVAIWDLITLMVNGLVFLLIGMEFGALRSVFVAYGTWQVLWHALAVLLVLVAVRFLYIFAGNRRRRYRNGTFAHIDRREQFVIAWSGLRGVVSLATALALPLVTEQGRAFDHRDEILVITSIVIAGSLYGFGLPLPWILKKLNFSANPKHLAELKLARKTVLVTMLDEMKQTVTDSPHLAPQMQDLIKEFEARLGKMPSDGETRTVEEIQKLLHPRMIMRQKAISNARRAVLELSDQGRIGNEVRRQIERELDFQELQFTQM